MRSAKDTKNVTVDDETTTSVTTTEFAYDAIGRRVASRTETSGGLVKAEGYFGPSDMPELIFAVPVTSGSTDNSILLHQSRLPGVDGVIAINGYDATGQTVWTLPDYGGSTRAYASVNSDDSLSALLHQNFDGQGLPISVINQSAGRFTDGSLPVHFAGYQLDAATGLYFVGGAVGYDPKTGRRLASSSGGGNDRYGLDTNYGTQRLTEVEQPTYGEVFWDGYKELLKDPSKLDNGYRQAFYVSATVAGVAAIAAGGIVLAGAGVGVTTFGGLAVSTEGIAGTLVGQAAIGAGVSTSIGVGVAAYKGESLATASIVSAGAGLIGGPASHAALGLVGRHAASRAAQAIVSGFGGGAAEGAFRATLDGKSVGGIARAAVVDGLIGAATAGLLDRAIVGIVHASQAVRNATSKFTVAPNPGAFARPIGESNHALDFAARYAGDFDTAIANRMRALGVPEDMIGGVTQKLGGTSGAFNPKNFNGGGVFGRRIEVDAGVLVDNNLWRNARLRDRIDAVIAHEFEEALSPARNVFSRHLHSLHNAPTTNLPISDNARAILRTKLQVEAR